MFFIYNYKSLHLKKEENKYLYFGQYNLAMSSMMKWPIFKLSSFIIFYRVSKKTPNNV